MRLNLRNYEGSTWSPFSIIPLWTARGYADTSFLAATGASNCVAAGQCVTLNYPETYFAPGYGAVSFGDTITFAGTLLTDKSDRSGLLYRRNRYYDPATGRFTQEDPMGLAGGLNVYGFAGGDQVNFSDPFGLCVPSWLCNAWAKYQSWRSEQIQKGEEWKRAHGNPQLVEAVVPSWSGGPANLERSAATLARQAKRFANAVKALDEGHLAIAAREAAGEVTGWDHVTEVTSSMNSMRRIIRSMSGYLKNPNLTAEMRAGGEQLLQNAQDALARAEQVIK